MSAISHALEFGDFWHLLFPKEVHVLFSTEHLIIYIFWPCVICFFQYCNDFWKKKLKIVHLPNREHITFSFVFTMSVGVTLQVSNMDYFEKLYGSKRYARHILYIAVRLHICIKWQPFAIVNVSVKLFEKIQWQLEHWPSQIGPRTIFVLMDAKYMECKIRNDMLNKSLHTTCKPLVIAA